MSSIAAIDRFAQAWGEPDRSRRADHVRAAFASTFTYADPRSPEPVTSHDDFTDMLSHYVSSMPGAGVELDDDGNARADCALARLSFVSESGVMGRGVYYFELDGDGLISKAVGFVDKS